MPDLPSLPTGTVTFLFTDVEGSTRLWEEHSDSMKDWLAAHDTLLRQAIEENGGYVFSTAGDSFGAAFQSANDAMAAALAAQLALGQSEVSSLTVRMGLHTGEAQERSGDYFGSPLNRAARLMSAGHGGQVLVSGATQDLVTAQLPDPVSLIDLGEYRLKDLTRSERVFQLTHPSLPREFPPLNTLDLMPNNLPAAISSFVGREAELDGLERQLAQSRLVTLTGYGGAGKTRTAIELARRVLPGYPDGVWMLQLAPLTDGDLIVGEVLTALGIEAPVGRDRVEVLCDRTAHWQALFIFDNCEHLLGDAAALVRQLLEAVPRAKVLATSRRALTIAGETVWQLAALELPDERVSTTEVVAESDAVRLFVERASGARKGFTLDDDNARSIAQLCARLDGMPMAIELAAARTTMMSVGEINDKLEDRFRFLVGGDRTEAPHHQTLLGTVEWSYDLLRPEPQELYRALSVFRGGFTLGAAERGGSTSSLEETEVFGYLDDLVAQSLVAADHEQSTTRYSMLETVRAHGAALLEEQGEEAAVSAAMLGWATEMVRKASRAYGLRIVDWVDDIEQEIDNIRAALEWGVVNDPATGLELMAHMSLYWWLRDSSPKAAGEKRTSRLDEGAEWAARLFDAASDDVDPITLARGKMSVGGMLLTRLGRNDEAVPLLREAIDAFAELGEQRREGWATYYLSISGWRDTKRGETLRLAERALGLLTDAEDELGIAYGTLGYGTALAFAGESEESWEAFETLDAIGQDWNDPGILGHSRDGLALAAVLTSGDVDYAALLRSSLSYLEELGAASCAAHTIGTYSAWLASEGQLERSAFFEGVAQGIRDELPVVTQGHEDRAAFAERLGLSELDPAVRAKAFAEGRARGLDGIALAVEALADS